jgi:hypothetical protein
LVAWDDTHPIMFPIGGRMAVRVVVGGVVGHGSVNSWGFGFGQNARSGKHTGTKR